MRKWDEKFERGLGTIDPLAGADPEALAREFDPDELLSRILATPNAEPAAEPRTARLPRRRRLVFIAAPLAAAALLVAAVGIPTGSDGPATLPALSRVAEAAAAQPPAPTDLPYRYEKTREGGVNISVANGHSWGILQSSTIERWVAKDGSGLERITAEVPEWPSSWDREQWEAADRIPFLAHGWKSHSEELRYPANHFSSSLVVGSDRAAVDFDSLPTDPEKLAAWIESVAADPRSDHGPSGEGRQTERAMTLVTDLLNEPKVSPELRAALCEALGMIPGIEDFGAVTDAAGRRGVGVGVDSDYSGGASRYMLIFDPQTGQVLAREEIWLEPPRGLHGEPSGGVSWATLYLGSGGSERLGEPPTAR